VIVAREGHPPPTLAELTAFLREREVPQRQWPERVEVAGALPRNATGKVLKAELRQRFGAPAGQRSG
jgi:acyl-CoA synthetase (AMP-forming)/AMP-acid ligase II